MKQMSWQNYYDGFFGWSFSTQKSYACRLSGYGPAAEVWELAQELAFYDEGFASGFLEKAFAAGVRFEPAQVLEMTFILPEPLLSKFARETSVPFAREELEEICTLIDEDSFLKISGQAGICLWTGEDSPGQTDKEDVPEPAKTPDGRISLCGILGAFLAGILLAGYRRSGKEQDRDSS